MKLWVRSNFSISVLFLVGALAFALVSIDRAKIQSIAIIGELSESQILSVKDRLLAIDIEAEQEFIRDELLALEWIDQVNVRRQWPNAIGVEIVPETVVAYWNDDGFINSEGRVLVTDLIAAGDLPGLYGPDGSEREVMSRFQELGGILTSHGIVIRNLTRSDLGSWTIETRRRITILLGKEDLRERLDRFLAVRELLQSQSEVKRIRRMDARYINGVAVQFDDELNLSNEVVAARSEINETLGVQSL